jgi:uncharacterized protein YycO
MAGSSMGTDNSETPSKDMVFTLRADRLRPGDILLTTQVTSAVSKVIRVVTNSDFSHAAIVLFHSQCIETVDAGVRVICLDRIYISDPKNIRILRARNDGEIGRRAAELARTHLFKPYWIEGAIKAPSSSQNVDAQEHRFFCSHLVAHCYKEAGISLLPRRAPEKIVPGHLLDSAELIDVSSTVLVETHITEAPAHALDLGDYPESGEDLFAKTNKRISDDVSNALSGVDWFKPLAHNLHQFPHWHAVFFLPLSEEHKRIYDLVLRDALRHHRFLDIIPIDIPRLNPETYMAKEDWEKLSDFLSETEIRGEHTRLQKIEQTLAFSGQVFEKDLVNVEGLWRTHPTVSQYEAATMLLRFYRQRVSATHQNIRSVKEKVTFLETKMCG